MERNFVFQNEIMLNFIGINMNENLFYFKRRKIKRNVDGLDIKNIYQVVCLRGKEVDWEIFKEIKFELQK